MQQVGSPTVEHGEKTDLGAKVFRVGGDAPQGFGGGPKENAVHHLLILVGNGRNLFRHREDHVEVFAIEKFGLAALDPLHAGQRLTLWAMTIPAGPVTDALVAALIALLNLSTESCRSAHLDGRHDAPLRCRHRRAILLSIGFTYLRNTSATSSLGRSMGPALRSAEAGREQTQRQWDGGAGRADWRWNRPYWWRFAGTGPWWPGCGARAAVEWCERQFPIPVNGLRIRSSANGE